MAADILANYVEATVTTSLNGTDAAGTSDAVTVSAVSSAWPSLSSGVTQMRVMDKADLGVSSGYEIMVLTADNAGAAGSWTLTRGAEGSTVHTHAASWTLVPATSAAGLTAVASALKAHTLLTGTSNATVPFGANFAVAIRVVPPGSWTVTKLGCMVATAAGNVALAVYSDNGSNAPGTLKVQTASTAVSATGPLTISLGGSFTVNSGDWLALAADTVSSQFVAAVVGTYPSWFVAQWNAGSLTLASNPTVGTDSRAFVLWGE